MLYGGIQRRKKVPYLVFFHFVFLFKKKPFEGRTVNFMFSFTLMEVKYQLCLKIFYQLSTKILFSSPAILLSLVWTTSFVCDEFWISADVENFLQSFPVCHLEVGLLNFLSFEIRIRKFMFFDKKNTYKLSARLLWSIQLCIKLSRTFVSWQSF